MSRAENTLLPAPSDKEAVAVFLRFFICISCSGYRHISFRNISSSALNIQGKAEDQPRAGHPERELGREERRGWGGGQGWDWPPGDSSCLLMFGLDIVCSARWHFLLPKRARPSRTPWTELERWLTGKKSRIDYWWRFGEVSELTLGGHKFRGRGRVAVKNTLLS